jgi:hypothetical protein
MKTKNFIPAALMAAALFGTAAAAQSGPSAQQNAPDTPTPNQFVYLAQMPSPAELKSRAAAQGVTVERVDQTPNQTIVVYKYPNGVTTTVGYGVMPAGDEAPAAAAPAGAPNPPAPTTAAPAPGTVVTPATSTVVYSTPYPAYGYPYYPYYGWGWFPPVTVGLGFGWGWGGGWRGGWGGGWGHGWHR